MPQPLTLVLLKDTGASANDQITASGQIQVSGLELGGENTWQYSIDSGKSWSERIPVTASNTFEIPDGVYGSRQVRVRQQIAQPIPKGNLLVNGSFEQGWVGNGWTGLTTLPGWKTGDRFEIWGKGMTPASDGNYLLEIDYAGKDDFISQTVNTVKDARYLLQFDMKSRGGSKETLDVTWRGEKISTVSTAKNNGWTTFSFDVTGSGTADELRFNELKSENNGLGSLIDNVRLTFAELPLASTPTNANIEEFFFPNPITVDRKAPTLTLKTPGGKDGVVSSNQDDRLVEGTAEAGSTVRLMIREEKSESFENGLLPSWINLDIPNTNIADIKLDTKNGELDFSSQGGRTNIWTTRDNAPIAWISRPTVAQGESWFIETKVRVDKRSQGETISGITFYNDKNGDFQYGAPSFYLDSWHYSGTNVTLQGLGNNSPFVTASGVSTLSGDTANVYLRAEITEKGSSDDYRFFYRKSDAEPWIKLGDVYSYSIDNSRAALFYKTGSAKAGGAAFDDLRVGKISENLLATQVNVNEQGIFSYTLTDENLKQLGEGNSKSLLAVQTDQAGNVGRSTEVRFGVDTEVTPVKIISIGGGDGKVSSERVETGSGPLKLNLDQYTGYWSSKLTDLQNYVKNYNPLSSKNKFSVTTDAIDFTDDQGGFAGELPYDKRWPAAEAANFWGTGGINNQFFAKVSGEFSVAQSGNYRFRTFNDDGVFLLIDGVLVINDPTLHPERVFTGDIKLEPGNHNLELYFFENGGEASLEFSVSTFDLATQKWSPYQLMGKDPSIKAKSSLEIDNRITGTGAPNTKTFLKLDDQELGSTTTNSEGVFEYRLSVSELALLSDNVKKSSLIAFQLDSAGNRSTSTPGEIALTDKPPVVEIQTVGQQDKMVSGNIGDSEVVGQGSPGLKTLIKNGTSDLGQVVADQDGTFKYVLTKVDLDKLGEGTGKEIVTTQKTLTGIQGLSTAFKFSIDTVAPKVTINSIGKAGNKLSNKNNRITGTADPSTEVVIRTGELEIGKAVTDSNGFFKLDLSPSTLLEIERVNSGSPNQITISQSDSAGNIGLATSSPFTIKLLSPQITLGAIGGNDLTVSTQATDLLIKGTGEAGLPVELWHKDVLLGVTNPANSAGQFEYYLHNSDLSLLGEGPSKIITFKQLDEYDNEGALNSATFEVDTIAPTIIIAKSGSISSPGGPDGVISSQKGDRVVQGKGEANREIEISINDIKMNTLVDSEGFFSYELSPEDIQRIGQGQRKNLSITQSDQAGNVSTHSTLVDIDTIAPPNPTILDVASGGTVSGNANDNLITGNSEKDSKITLIVNGTFLADILTDTKGKFSYSLTRDDVLKVGEGSSTLVAEISDAAGNTSRSETNSFIIDTISPVQPTISSIGSDDLIVSTKGSGKVTESIDNMLVGSAESGSTVQILSANRLLGTTVADSNGEFIYRLSSPNIASLGQGKNKQISVIAADNAGNRSISTKPFDFSIDTIGPSSPKISSIGGVDGVISSIALDNKIIGVAEANSKLDLRATDKDGELLFNTSFIADNKGNWSYNLAQVEISILNNSQSFNSKPLLQLISSDSAGNESSSVAFTPILDIDAPVVGLTQVGGSDNVVSTKAGDAQIIGNAEPNGTVSIRVNNKLIATTKTDSLGKFSYLLTSANLKDIGEGSNIALQLSQVDKAGNTGNILKSFAVDTKAPGVAIIQSVGGFDKVVTSNEADRIVKGKAEAGSSIEILSVSGTKTTSLGTLVVGISGEFVYTLTPSNLVQLGQGVGKSIVVSSSDSAGNASMSKPYSFEVQGLWKIGTSSVDQMTLTTGIDAITGLGSADRFLLSSLSVGLITGNVTPTFDRLVDFQIGLDQIDAPRPIAAGAIKDLGTLQTLSTLHLGQLLNTQNFISNSGAVFRYQDSDEGQRTFLALNDNISGFDAKRDAIIEITGYSGSLGALTII